MKCTLLGLTMVFFFFKKKLFLACFILLGEGRIKGGALLPYRERDFSLIFQTTNICPLVLFDGKLKWEMGKTTEWELGRTAMKWGFF